MKKLHSLIATLLVFSIVLSMLSAVSFVSAAGTDIDVWDGTAATSFAGGAGTSANPYLIETPEQLYKALNDNGISGSTPLYYLIIKDLYLNQGYENYATWGDSAPANNWTPSTGDFMGHLDGGYHTIYGLYSRISKWHNGLFPALGNNSSVSNLKISNAYVRSNDGSGAVGAVAGITRKAGKINKCLVYNTVIVAGKDAGGIVGGLNAGNFIIENCGSYNITLNCTVNPGGIIGRPFSASVKVSLKNSYCVGYKPIGVDAWKTNITNINTDNNGNTNSGVVIHSNDVMKGEGAVATMALSNSVWKDTDSYPTFIGNGTKGETWRGTKAAWFADGNGTAADPYQIETPEQLFKAVCDLGKKADGTAAYYLITADLYLNKDYENYSAWGETAPANNWFTATYGEFKGHLDGGYHTVYGLYSSGNKWATGLLTFMGDGSTVSNLIVAKAYIYNSVNTAGVIAGSMKGNNVIDSCMVFDAVVSAPNGEEGKNDVGGIVGSVQTRTSKVSNCGTYNLVLNGPNPKGGIIGRVWQAPSGANGTRIHSCYSVDYYPLGDTGAIWANHNYTNVDGTKNDIATIDKSAMTGEAAVAGMKYLDFINTWQTTEEGYPTLRKAVNNNLSQEITSSFAVTDNGKAGVKFTSKVAMPKINPTFFNDIAVTIDGVKKVVSEAGIVISRTGIDVNDIATLENNPITGYKVVGYKNEKTTPDAVIKGGYMTVTALVMGNASYTAKSYMVFEDGSVVFGDVYNTTPSTESTTIDGIEVNDSFVNGDANFDGALNVLDFIKTKNYLALGDEFTAKDFVLDVIDTDSDKDFGANDITALKKVLLVGNGENPTQP